MEKRKHVYRDIIGFFDYEDLYELAVAQAPQQAHFVEVGTFCGCSAAFLAIEAHNSGKNITIDCIDSWDWNAPFHWHWAGPSRNIYECFLYNVKKYNLALRGTAISSLAAAEKTPDSSLDFVFLDADHSYEAVWMDINAWAKKVKPGGIIAGHDYRNSEFPGVYKAVHEHFNEDRVKLYGRNNNSWAVIVR